MVALLHRFFEDTRTQIALLLIGLDLALGIIASLKTKTFRLSFVSDFLRNDVLNKVLPFFIIYGGYVYAKNADIIIPGIDMEVIMDGAWVLALGSLTGSLLNSLRDLGLLGKQTPDAVAGPDPTTPVLPPDPTLP